MKVNEPIATYDCIPNQVEDLQSKLISAVKELKDIELLKRCYKMLCVSSTHKCELDLALEEMKQGKLNSYDSVEALFDKLNAENEISD